MKIDFEFETEFGVFRDSLDLPDDVTYGEDAIQNMKEQRRDKWIEFIKNAPEVVIEETIDG
jgi:hypothetical protein